MKTIYVGNLPFEAGEDELRGLFADHGEVLKVTLVTDQETGRPRGFGFVEMADDQAMVAIDALDGVELAGRQLRVNEARDRGARPPRRQW